MFGELTAIESLCHMIVTNNFKSSTISIQDPLDENNTIDLYIYKNKHSNIDVNFINGAPFIKVDCNLNARILSINENSNYTSEETIKALCESANKYLESNIYNYLYRISKVYNSDIAGFGKTAVTKFSTNQKWKNYNWLNNFQNSFFEVNVNTVVKSGFLLSEQ